MIIGRGDQFGVPKFRDKRKPAEIQRVNSWLGGERGIRTPGASQHGSFQDCCNRPLYHLSEGLGKRRCKITTYFCMGKISGKKFLRVII